VRRFLLVAALAFLAGCRVVAPEPAPVPPSATPSEPAVTSTAAPAPSTVVPIPPVTSTPVPTSTPTPTITPIPAGRVYPIHSGDISTTFWVGEIFNPKIPDGSQVCSTYDSQWAYHWSGVKTGVAGSGTDCAGSPTGGCDGVPGAGKCSTEARHPENGFYPTHSTVTPRENPFYLDIPFDDINDPTAFKTRCQVIPWANDAGYAGHCTDAKFSYMKNRWLKITGPTGAVCYGQVEDAGPSSGSAYHDAAYVFGANNAKPANREFNGAGMDVSPALNGCLKFAELDGENDHVSWQFVDSPPPGPWTKLVTTSGVTP
jgi:hypothetical protein